MADRDGKDAGQGGRPGEAGAIERSPRRDARELSDALAQKHRSASFDRNWRSVNYARLNETAATRTMGQGEAPASEILRADWNPAARPIPGRAAKPYTAHFGSFAGGPFHAEVERLAPGEKGRDADAPTDDDL